MIQILIVAIVLTWTRQLHSIGFKTKPMNCEFCLCFWITFVFECYINGTFIYSIALGCLNAQACWVINLLLDKLFVWVKMTRQ